ncbi:MAG: hypothetical protein JXB35_05310 [Anaerolineae bacterium]|nr:hypothetical protein [Anaerolineae bacterium]
MGDARFESRLQDVRRFYSILEALEKRVGGKRTLAEAHGRMEWPTHGVYFFFEPGEKRTRSGEGLRVVRAGTHGLKTGSKSTLWKRLRQHRGTAGGKYAGGGNHRGSIFRLHVGTALINRDEWSADISGEWGVGSSAGAAIRRKEHPLEQAVSQHIRSMPFLWVEINDPAGPESLRGYVKRNAIGLLSNWNPKRLIDPPSESWLGRWAESAAIRHSGLWSVKHVTDDYDPGFLDLLSKYCSRSDPV